MLGFGDLWIQQWLGSPVRGTSLWHGTDRPWSTVAVSAPDRLAESSQLREKGLGDGADIEHRCAAHRSHGLRDPLDGPLDLHLRHIRLEDAPDHQPDGFAGKLLGVYVHLDQWLRYADVSQSFEGTSGQPPRGPADKSAGTARKDRALRLTHQKSSTAGIATGRFSSRRRPAPSMMA